MEIRFDFQDFADRLCAYGLDASTVRNALIPLRMPPGRAPGSHRSGLHERGRTFASLMIAAGVNAKAIRSGDVSSGSSRGTMR